MFILSAFSHLYAIRPWIFQEAAAAAVICDEGSQSSSRKGQRSTTLGVAGFDLQSRQDWERWPGGCWCWCDSELNNSFSLCSTVQSVGLCSGIWLLDTLLPTEPPQGMTACWHLCPHCQPPNYPTPEKPCDSELCHRWHHFVTNWCITKCILDWVEWGCCGALASGPVTLIDSPQLRFGNTLWPLPPHPTPPHLLTLYLLLRSARHWWISPFTGSWGRRWGDVEEARTSLPLSPSAAGWRRFLLYAAVPFWNLLPSVLTLQQEEL